MRPLLIFAALVVPLPLQFSDWVQDTVPSFVFSPKENATPKRIKTRGKARVADWGKVDARIKSFADAIDLDGLVSQLRSRTSSPLESPPQLEDRLNRLLLEYSIPFESVFLLEREDALFPLTNNVLKHTRDSIIKDLPLFDNRGKPAGTAEGKGTYEKTSDLFLGNRLRLEFLVYRDANGQLGFSSQNLLLDSFNVRWKELKRSKGFFPFSARVERNPIRLP
ncbi:MAG: hypothetical protein HY652_12630 [Acidobacteria bacterium]|nr:hypothetical protein [Acidobacteriota bacterium]